MAHRRFRSIACALGAPEAVAGVVAMALVALVSLGAIARPVAAEDLAPYAYVTSSADGRVYFRMTPDKDEKVHGRGTLFAVGQGGEPDRALWSTEGWWAQEVHVSSFDERALVRVGGTWHSRDRDAGDLDAAVAFYRDGKLVRRYTSQELLGEEKDRLPRRTGSFPYLDFDEPARLVIKQVGEGAAGPAALRFQMKLTNGWMYWFDVATGQRMGQGGAGAGGAAAAARYPDRLVHMDRKLVRVTVYAGEHLDGVRRVAAALAKRGERAEEFFMTAGEVDTRGEDGDDLVIELWHESAFGQGPGVVGNPGGKCRNAHVGGKTGEVRFLFWQ